MKLTLSDYLGSMAGSQINLSLEITGIGLTLLGLSALWVAWRQLSMMVRQTRAAILLDLDHRWESEPMLSIRAEVYEIMGSVREEAAKRWPGLKEQEHRTRSAEIYADQLQQLRTAEKVKYLRLFQVCGFFETVGHVARAKYIPAKDVINLLGGSILQAGMVFRPHIEKLLAEEGAYEKMYEHFLWLLRETETAEKVTVR